MSTYYYRDGQLYTTKTMCNLAQTWQHECRVHPDEAHFEEMQRRARDAFSGQTVSWNDFMAGMYEQVEDIERRKVRWMP